MGLQYVNAFLACAAPFAPSGAYSALQTPYLDLRGFGEGKAGYGPASPLLAVPNVTTHSSTANVLCGINVAIKGLKDGV